MNTSTSTFSQEPIVNWIVRHLALLLTACYALSITYMSLIPFNFVASPAWDPTVRYLGYLRLNDVSMTDVIANIGAYMPLGALFFCTLRRRRVWRLIALFGAVFFGYLLSFAIEHAQHWLDARVSSWVDVVANTLGTLSGGLLAFFLEPLAQRMLLHLQKATDRNWYMLLAKLAACCMLVASLRPFDVVLDVRSAAAALPKANFLFDAKWHELPLLCAEEIESHQRKGMFELDRMRADYLVDRVVDVWVYAGLTLLLCAGLIAGGTRGFWTLWAYSGLLVQTLAVAIVVIRHFLSTWGMDTAHFLCAIIGWAIGILILACVRAIGRRRKVDTEATLQVQHWLQSRFALGVTCLLAMGVLAAYELSPFQVESVDHVLSQDKINLVPFQPHFLNRPNKAIFDITGEILRYGALAFCMISLLSRHASIEDWRRRALACIGFCGITAAVAEICHLFIRARMTDITTVVLAAAAAAMACVAYHALYDLRRLVLTHHAEDLLTSQLIEGGTYDKEAAKKLAKSRDDASRKAASRSAPPD